MTEGRSNSKPLSRTLLHCYLLTTLLVMENRMRLGKERNFQLIDKCPNSALTEERACRINAAKGQM